VENLSLENLKPKELKTDFQNLDEILRIHSAIQNQPNSWIFQESEILEKPSKENVSN
jgi:hypothetical protein